MINKGLLEIIKDELHTSSSCILSEKELSERLGISQDDVFIELLYVFLNECISGFTVDPNQGDTLYIIAK